MNIEAYKEVQVTTIKVGKAIADKIKTCKLNFNRLNLMHPMIETELISFAVLVFKSKLSTEEGKGLLNLRQLQEETESIEVVTDLLTSLQVYKGLVNTTDFERRVIETSIDHFSSTMLGDKVLDTFNNRVHKLADNLNKSDFTAHINRDYLLAEALEYLEDKYHTEVK